MQFRILRGNPSDVQRTLNQWVAQDYIVTTHQWSFNFENDEVVILVVREKVRETVKWPL